MTVQAFLEGRLDALKKGDFASVYQSYHAESPFLRQFSDLDDYLGFAEQQLTGISIKSWHCPAQRVLADNRVECLLVMELETGGDSLFFYELALLVQVDGQWRYHSAQKLGAEDFSGEPDSISFSDFDRVEEKIRF